MSSGYIYFFNTMFRTAHNQFSTHKQEDNALQHTQIHVYLHQQ